MDCPKKAVRTEGGSEDCIERGTKVGQKPTECRGKEEEDIIREKGWNV